MENEGEGKLGKETENEFAGKYFLERHVRSGCRRAKGRWILQIENFSKGSHLESFSDDLTFFSGLKALSSMDGIRSEARPGLERRGDAVPLEIPLSLQIDHQDRDGGRSDTRNS